MKLMDNTNFVWADLSTFDLEQTKLFYADLFDWQISGSPDEYNLCLSKSGDEAAGQYVMPAFFQKIKMPSFWMSYIQVDDIQNVVKAARQQGGKVELGPEPFGGDIANGQIALIRDPLGAGFTVFEGEMLQGKDVYARHGRMVWNELYISEIETVQSFYENLFQWTIDRIGTSDRFDIKNSVGEPVGNIEQISNAIKGNLEFWGIYFSVSDLDHAMKVVNRHSGSIVYDDSSAGVRQLMVEDPQGAVFFLIQDQSAQTTRLEKQTNQIKWRPLLGLGLIFCAILFNWNWIWSLLFLLWVIPDIVSGVTYFLEPIYKLENPALYWAVIITWLTLSIYPLFALLGSI